MLVIISSKSFILVVSLKSFTVNIFSIRRSETILDISYRSKYIDAYDILVFVLVRIKKYYDIKYIFIFFKVEEHVHLRLHKDY